MEVTSGHLQVSAIDCSYGSTRAVVGAAFEVEPGGHVAILGANGSGKSTLLRALTGLHRPDQGAVILDGTPLTRSTAPSRCAWIPQRQPRGDFPLLVAELISSTTDRATAECLAARFDVAHLFERRVDSLSGGQLQRVFLARAIGSIESGGVILFADEPTAALDFSGRNEAVDQFSNLRVTTVIATHDRLLAESCDRRFEMAAGELREIP